MIKNLRSNHFTSNPNFIDRFEKDSKISSAQLKSRGIAFEILESLVPGLTNPKLISSSIGAFDQILLTIPSWVFLDPAQERDPYLNVYSDLVNKLPSTTKLIILTNKDAEVECNNWLVQLGIAGRTTLGFAPKGLHFSIWAEDAYCMAKDVDSGKTFFIESASFDRYDDEYIADEVSKFTDLQLSLANVYFQGGNVLIGDDIWLIGLDYPNKSFDLGYIAQNQGENKLEATRRVYGKLMDHQRTLYPIGTHLPVPAQTIIPQVINGQTWNHVVYRGNHQGTTQPLFHIDMFITLLGKSISGKNLVMVADPSIAADVLGDTEIVKFSSQFSMQSVFDDIAKRLEDIGFDVIRNPLPSAYAVDKKKKRILWYFATANNSLVQVKENSKDIWIPQYGFGSFPELSTTDLKNREILESVGFTVHGLGDFHPFATGLGAVHCISKYVSRVPERTA